MPRTFSHSPSRPSSRQAPPRGRSRRRAGPDAATLLQGAGLRVTPARVAVWEMLQSSDTPMSHADLEQLLPEAMDRVTLYRTLDRLHDAGLLHRRVGDDRVMRFATHEVENAHARHAHFRCDSCGRLYWLDAKPPRKPALPDGFVVEGAEWTLHGICPRCNR